MSILKVDELTELEKILADFKGLVVIDFYATWCGPCKMISPKIEEMAKEFTDVKFLKVDVDENDEAAAKYEVSAMPTFLFMKGGAKVEAVVGASEEKIKSAVIKHK